MAAINAGDGFHYRIVVLSPRPPRSTSRARYPSQGRCAGPTAGGTFGTRPTFKSKEIRGQAKFIEILRVLDRAGALALIWNVRDDRVPWVAAFSRLLDSYAGASPRQSSTSWRAIFNDARFERLTSKSYLFTQPLTPIGLVNRALSTSFIALPPRDEQEIVSAKVMDIVESELLLVSRDSIQFPYVTELYVFRKRS